MKVYIIWKTTHTELFDHLTNDAYVRAVYPVRTVIGVFDREEAARCVLAGRVDPDEELEIEEHEVHQ